MSLHYAACMSYRGQGKAAVTGIETDEYWMRQALALAGDAAATGEVPVGAVLVRDGELIAAGGNRPIAGHDATAHAEIVALRRGCERERNYRLPGTTLYVTIEPCTMCYGAMVHARIERLVYGASEPRAGVCESRLHLPEQDFYNHRISVTAGVLREECSWQLKDFFAGRR